ncbi:uncharacterized protein PHACADRAFT_210620 [Phanerochaete carnosa HHB-10118-sp]|uniref:Aminoacyl-transfer RNA synthetases class-II family profile domain-containing protein n=1 Tax=Phanerochaete carnosa (strain HHB-10118-sp) TaxID=650164 RepID=K5W6T9_PHACS|nr:uncharacterized protein PHACADRAFT_210620 [Phanerochaete carnosa HHB-10118-sp]EKM54845.1 hypothetical protein PHACADRAFT_210620 [Phanerochaete carnosa HHB-10118-sp]
MYDVMDITESLIEGAVKHLAGRKTTVAFHLEGRDSKKVLQPKPPRPSVPRHRLESPYQMKQDSHVLTTHLIGILRVRTPHVLPPWFAVDIVGNLECTKGSELSITPFNLARNLARNLIQLPVTQGQETRDRKRYLDLGVILNEDTKHTFIACSQIVNGIRRFFDSLRFLVIETPVIAGGATVKPFIVHHSDLNLDSYLRISPEFYLTQLVFSELDGVYEINRFFRNKGVDLTRYPELSICKSYMAYANMSDIMVAVEGLIESLAKESHQVSDRREGDSDFPPRRREGVRAGFKAVMGATRHIHGAGEAEFFFFLPGEPLHTEEANESLRKLCQKHNIELRANPSLSASSSSLSVSPAFYVGLSQLNDALEQRLWFEKRARRKEQGDVEDIGDALEFHSRRRADGIDRGLAVFLADSAEWSYWSLRGSRSRRRPTSCVPSGTLDKFVLVFSRTLDGWEIARLGNIFLSFMTQFPSFEVRAITFVDVPAAFFSTTAPPIHAPEAGPLLALEWLDLGGFAWNKRDTVLKLWRRHGKSIEILLLSAANNVFKKDGTERDRRRLEALVEELVREKDKIRPTNTLQDLMKDRQGFLPLQTVLPGMSQEDFPPIGGVRWVEVPPQAGWQTMTKTVREYDEDKVKDCKEDISTLLLFMSLITSSP